MTVSYVGLQYCPGMRWAGLREMAGRDEEMVDSVDTGAAIRLLNALLVDGPAAMLRPGMVAQLTAADRDRLSAQLYIAAFGPRISSVVDCVNCGRSFDMDFQLPELVERLNSAPTEIYGEHDGRYTFRLADGRIIRLPTGEDELAVWGLPLDQAAAELLRRCLVTGDVDGDADVLQAALAQIAPMIEADLEARCPECGNVQVLHFDIQSYLLATIQAERPQRLREVHEIATAYGWELETILGLARSNRRAYGALIEADRRRIDQRTNLT